MKQIILVKKGVLTKNAKKALDNAEIVYIECDDFNDVEIKTINCDVLNSKESDAFAAALETLANCQYDSIPASFVKKLHRIYAAHKNKGGD